MKRIRRIQPTLTLWLDGHKREVRCGEWVGHAEPGPPVTWRSEIEGLNIEVRISVEGKPSAQAQAQESQKPDPAKHQTLFELLFDSGGNLPGEPHEGPSSP